ncbi:hypothetical protein ACFSC4_11700 [Deinococcus malanensis]|uniref:hypothetical protein n=1 Tax=Deinococcus malanensis TaxID=1706855 RepID=UPI0036272BF4
MSSAAPVGVFDSGVGGLSVLAELRRAMPHEEFLYLADTAHVPYGARSDDDIRELTDRAVSALHARGSRQWWSRATRRVPSACRTCARALPCRLSGSCRP